MGFPVDGVGGVNGGTKTLWSSFTTGCGLVWEYLRRTRIPRRGPDPRIVRLLTFRICEAVGGVILVLFFFDFAGALAGYPADPYRGIQETTRNLARASSLIYIVVIAWLLLLKKNRLRISGHGSFHVPAPYQILFLLFPLLLAESGMFHAQPLHVVCEILPAVISLYVGGQLLFIDRQPSETEVFTRSSGLNSSSSLVGDALLKATAHLHAFIATIRKMPYLLDYLVSALEGRALRAEYRRLSHCGRRQLLAALRHGNLVSANAVQIDIHSVSCGKDAARFLIVTACSNIHRVTRRRVGYMDSADPLRFRLSVGARDGLLMWFEYEQKEGKR